MHSDPYETALDRAAQRHGIESEYWDIWRKQHVTSAATKRAILTGFGVDVTSAASIEASLAERQKNEWLRALPPALVTGADPSRTPCPVRMPLGAASENGVLLLELEIGETRQLEASLASLPENARLEIDGAVYVEKLLPLPTDLPQGYHCLRLKHPKLPDAATRLIVAPDRAYQPEFLRSGGRAAGLAIALYGLRSARNWGCGDFSDLRGIIDWAAEDLQVSFIALNPLHAIHNRRPYNTSPYLPNCIYYRNFIYLDVEAVEDFERSPRAQACRRSREVEAEIEALRASEHVEYERVHALKLRLLKLAFAAFLRQRRQGTPRAALFAEFVRNEGDLLERFATYCALDEHLHRKNPELWTWPQWPAPYQDPDSAETNAFRRRRWRSVMFYQYLQWQIDLQLAEAHRYARGRLRIGLYHDLALATDKFGSDLWAHRPYFVAGCRVGSPPDDFSPKGQDWGFPPPYSDRHRASGYRLFSESIRKNCRHSGALRLDHVMRFFRLYWIPDGVEATEGAYVRDRYLDLIRILALESVRHKVLIVGEDLGTVEPFVQETLMKFGVFSYRLLYFEKVADGGFKPAKAYPRQALVSSTTHDLPTLAGFWRAEDIHARRRAEVIDEAVFAEQISTRNMEKQRLLELLHRHELLPGDYPSNAAHLTEWTPELNSAVIGFLASTPAQLMVINQEDINWELYQQNLPGTTWQYPNWGHKMRFSVEELRQGAQVAASVEMLGNWLEKSQRAAGSAFVPAPDEKRSH
jgi:4-alpha-glucanotransferase